MTDFRWASLQSGKAMHKLISAVFCNFGKQPQRNGVKAAAKRRAMDLGIRPSPLMASQTAAYSSRSFIVEPHGTKRSLRDSMQEVREWNKVFQC